MDPITPDSGAQPAVDLAAAGRTLPKRRPRPIDKMRTDAIVQATLSVLAESGYDGLTVDQVAKRATVSKATLYRRWASREELVVDAIRSMNPGVDFPDTGSLQGDLVAGVKDFLDNDNNIRIVVGIASALPRHPELRKVLTEFLSERTDKSFDVYRRAAERGEIADDRHASRLTALLRGVLINELLFNRGAIDRDFIIDIIDEVIVRFATSSAAS